jgi:hypothetical protein
LGDVSPLPRTIAPKADGHQAHSDIEVNGSFISTPKGWWPLLGSNNRSAQRRFAKVIQCQIAHPFRITLACYREFDDFLGDYFGGEIVLICESEGRARQFECDAHNALGLWVEVLALQV